MEQSARRSVKAGFVLDQLARQEELGIEQDELNSFVIEQAYRMGVQPDRLAQELTDRGQIGSVITEVLRGKALTLITERATVTDEAGQPVDVSAALQPDETAETSEAGDAEAGSAGAEDSPAEDSLAEASAPEASAAEAGAAEASAPKKARARKPRAPKAKAAASAGDAEEGSADDEPGGSTA
jgi:trigger factor